MKPHGYFPFPIFDIFSDSNNDDGGDRISRLPDEILSHILSFIPTEEALATRFLSKRWNRKQVYKTVPALDLIYEFRRRIRSVAVDGESLMAAANDAYKKSLARIEAKDAAAKAASKREEERVKNLKKIRGERWLPSLAKEMQVKSQH